MAETRRKFDRDFKEGAVRLVRETGRPIAQVAKGLSINDGCCGRSRPGQHRHATTPGTAAGSRRRANRDKPDKYPGLSNSVDENHGEPGGSSGPYICEVSPPEIA
jgi:hypothetical protein